MRADLSERVAFITGAAAGIGAAIAKLFAANGAAVVIADINETGAQAMASQLPRSLAVGLDIRSEKEVASGLDATLRAFGRIDILVNNAGVNTLAHRVEIDEFPTEEWRRIVSIDLDGTFLVSRLLSSQMVSQGGGR